MIRRPADIYYLSTGAFCYRGCCRKNGCSVDRFVKLLLGTAVADSNVVETTAVIPMKVGVADGVNDSLVFLDLGVLAVDLRFRPPSASSTERCGCKCGSKQPRFFAASVATAAGIIVTVFLRFAVELSSTQPPPVDAADTAIVVDAAAILVDLHTPPADSSLQARLNSEQMPVRPRRCNA